MATFTALYDACVLYPAPLRDLLIRVGGAGLVRARWTDRIHEEWMSSLLVHRPDLARARLERTRDLMNASILDCLVTDYEDLVESIEFPDENDRHVLAAAIRGRADVIATSNLQDFPVEVVSRYQVDVQHPDMFIGHLLGLDEAIVCQAVRQQRLALRNPPRSPEELLDILQTLGLTETVAQLRPLVRTL